MQDKASLRSEEKLAAARALVARVDAHIKANPGVGTAAAAKALGVATSNYYRALTTLGTPASSITGRNKPKPPAARTPQPAKSFTTTALPLAPAAASPARISYQLTPTDPDPNTIYIMVAIPSALLGSALQLLGSAQ